MRSRTPRPLRSRLGAAGRILLTWGWILFAPVSVCFALWVYGTYKDYHAFVLRCDASRGPNRVDLRSIGQLRFHALKRDLNLLLLPQGSQPVGSLPVLDLFVPTESIESLAEHLPHSGFQYQPAVLQYPDGEVCRVKVRYRGDLFYHWALKKKSWRIKTKRGSLYNGMRHFNLVIPKRPALLNNYLSYKLAERMNLLAPGADLVVLRLNGVNQGIHVLTEQVREELLRRRNRLPGDVYVGDLTWQSAFRGAPSLLFTNAEYWEKVAFNSHYPEESRAPLEHLIEVLRRRESEETHAELLRLLDLDVWARFAAFLTLTQSRHVDDRHNWKLYYDPGRETFEPIVWDVVGWSRYSDSPAPAVRPDLVSSQIMRMLHRNHRFLLAKHRAIHDFFASGEDERFLAFVDEAITSVLPEVRKDPALVFAVGRTHPAHLTPHAVARALPALRAHITRVFREVKLLYLGTPPSLQYSWDRNEGELRVGLSGRQPVEKLTLEFADDLDGTAAASLAYGRDGDTVRRDIVAATYRRDRTVALNVPLLAAVSAASKRPSSSADTALSWQRAVYTVQLPGTQGHQLLELQAEGVNAPIETSREDRNLADVSFNDNYAIAPLEPFRRSITWTGTVEINELLKIDQNLVIRPGTRVLFAPGAGVIMRGRLTAEGTHDAPISFAPKHPDQPPWGALVLMGPRADRSVFRHCHFRGGSGLKSELFEYSAMLSLRDVKGVTVQHCHFQDSRIVDDMMHAIYSEIRVADTAFQRAHGDALDVDICRAVIERCEFSDSGNDAVDLMTSEVVIRHSVMRNSGDKGISVGENSYLFAFDNRLVGNVIGVQAKDQSQAVLYNVDLRENRKALDAYNKNWRYGGGGTIRLYKARVTDNEESFTADGTSRIWVYDSFVDDTPKDTDRITLHRTVDRGHDGPARVRTLWRHPDEAHEPERVARYWSDVNPARRGARDLDH